MEWNLSTESFSETQSCLHCVCLDCGGLKACVGDKVAGLGQTPEAFPRLVVTGRSNGIGFEFVKMFPVIETIFTVMNFITVSGTSYMSLLWKGWILFWHAGLLFNELTFHICYFHMFWPVTTKNNFPVSSSGGSGNQLFFINLFLPNTPILSKCNHIHSSSPTPAIALG